MRLLLTKYTTLEQEAKLLTRLGAFTADLTNKDFRDTQEDPGLEMTINPSQEQGIQ
jgi:hypothetical protein